jgi:hypothetical protein
MIHRFEQEDLRTHARDEKVSAISEEDKTRRTETTQIWEALLS